MEIKQRLRELLNQSLPEILIELQVEVSREVLEYVIELPKVRAHGDLATNLAFSIAKLAKKNPYQIALTCGLVLERIVKRETNDGWIEKISIEKPGFINFQLTKNTVMTQIFEIYKKAKNFGQSNAGSGKKVMLEFVSANPTGPLTIAHGRQAALGDTLARILKAVGYQPHKEFYLNDRGRQIRLLGESLFARYLELAGIPTPLPDDGYQGEYLIDLAKRLQGEVGDEFVRKSREESVPRVTEYAVQAMMSEINQDLKLMDVTFDEFFSEKSLAEAGKIDQALDALKKKGFIFEADGALWFQSTRLGDDKDRVLRKQSGELTYLAPDIAYHQSKFERGFDLIINFWGPDHHGYIARVRAACEALGFSSKALKVLIVQLTTLYRHGKPVRMSTRKGEFVTLKELVDEVGGSAARFFFLMRKVESHLDFDLELAKQKTDENPVYYVQYAHARISSILQFSNTPVTSDVKLELINSEEELELTKKLSEFPDVLVQAALHLEPYRVVDYLREVAAHFHKFYAKHRVVGDDAPLTQARLLLVQCVQIVIRNGLDIIGVEAPCSM